MREHKKRRTVRGDGFALAPVPEIAQHGERGTFQKGCAFDAPDLVLVHHDRHASIPQ
jgi:hypothetical protein